jgi:hypothetical protein
MTQQASSASQDFYRAVTILRRLHPRYRHHALYAAMFWSDERLLNAEANGDLPGNPGGLAEPEQDHLAPVLKLVFDRSNSPKAVFAEILDNEGGLG